MAAREPTRPGAATPSLGTPAGRLLQHSLRYPSCPAHHTGNGCIGATAGVCGDSLYGDFLSLAQYHGHGFISDKNWDAANAACGNWSVNSLPCDLAVVVAAADIGSGGDVYDLYSGTWGAFESRGGCAPSDSGSHARRRTEPPTRCGEPAARGARRHRHAPPSLCYPTPRYLQLRWAGRTEAAQQQAALAAASYTPRLLHGAPRCHGQRLHDGSGPVSGTAVSGHRDWCHSVFLHLRRVERPRAAASAASRRRTSTSRPV